MHKEPIVKLPFHEHLDFLCHIEKDFTAISPEFRLRLVVPKASTGKVMGYVSAGKEVFDRIGFGSSEEHGCRLAGSEVNFQHESIESDSFGISSFASGYRNTFQFGHVTIQRRSFSQIRAIRFYLGGPHVIWNDNPCSNEESDGRISFHNDSYVVESASTSKLEVRISQTQLVEEEEGQPTRSRVASIPIMEFKPKVGMQELPDETFIHDAISISDKLCLLASLASRSRCGWIRYSQTIPTQQIEREYVRSTVDLPNQKVEYDDCLVNPNKRTEYFETAYTAFGVLPVDISRIERIVSCYAAACESRIAEERFAGMMWAFESLVGELSPKLTIPKLCDSEFGKIVAGMEDLINENVSDPDVKAYLLRIGWTWKNSALKEKMTVVFRERGLEWMDLFPNNDFTLNRTRAQLFHYLAHDHEDLNQQIVRVQSLVERLMLNLFGWDDYSRSPDSQVQYWLKNPDDK